MKINLFDNNFRHTSQALGFDSASLTKPDRMLWVRDNLNWKGVTVFTDEFCLSPIVDRVQTDYKIAWLMEPPSIKSISSNIKQVQHKFDLILSYLPIELLGISEKKYRWIPSGGAWVAPQPKLEKNKLVSLIASQKRITQGHNLRHLIANMTRNKIDVIGNGYKPFDKKEDGHNPYMFSIVIENDKYPKFFSEKLLDCFLCRCVPIYWGAEEIGDIFDMNGVINFSTEREILQIIDLLNKDAYERMLSSIENNFVAASKIKSTDDIIFDLINKEFAANNLVLK